MSWENDIIKALEEYIEQDKTETPATAYDHKFFQNHLKYKPFYHFIADIIVGHFRPQSVIDWGCGCGFLLERLHEHGIADIHGVEGSKEAVPFWSERIKSKLAIDDILIHKVKVRKYDVAVCMEVGEHMEDEYSDALVVQVAGSVERLIWWTAAQPGQGGTNHINCRPLSYWEKKFIEQTDFKPEWELTYQMKQEMLKNQLLCIGYPWFRDNLIIFVRK